MHEYSLMQKLQMISKYMDYIRLLSPTPFFPTSQVKRWPVKGVLFQTFFSALTHHTCMHTHKEGPTMSITHLHAINMSWRSPGQNRLIPLSLFFSLLVLHGITNAHHSFTFPCALLAINRHLMFFSFYQFYPSVLYT